MPNELTDLNLEIDRQDSNNLYPLTPQQLALWLLQQREPKSTDYNVGFACRIVSDLNTAALRMAFQTILNRHGSLRTVFLEQNGEAQQKAEATQAVFFVETEAANSENALYDQMIEAHHQPFDLEKGPLLRVHLFTQKSDRYILLISIHHIVSDGVSLDILLEETRLLYSRFSGNAMSALTEPKVNYADYEQWLHHLLQSPPGEEMAGFWHQHLADERTTVLDLAGKRPSPVVVADGAKYEGASCGFLLSTEDTKRLRAFARSHRIAPLIVLFTAFQSLLIRYSGRWDFPVGLAVANRAMPKTDALCGYLSNILVMRVPFTSTENPLAAMHRVRELTGQALRHQSYPLPLLDQHIRQHNRVLGLPNSRGPVQAIFNYRKTLAGLSLFWTPLPEEEAQEVRAGTQVDWGGLSIQPFALPQFETISDLQIEIIDGGERIAGAFKYRANRFDSDTIERMTAHFQVLLNGIIEYPERPIAELPLLTEPEHRQLLLAWNDTGAEYPRGSCIQKLFEEQVEKSPDALAVVFGTQQLTYRALNERANQLAHHLQGLGVGPDSLVGLCLERSPDLLVGILGILKAGGAYLPLDIQLPAQRLAFMLQDASIEWMVTRQPLWNQLPATDCQFVCLDTEQIAFSLYPNDNPASDATGGNLAYVMYTSGSTGQPKGVAVCHSSVVNLLTAIQPVLQIEKSSRLLGLASPTFDISVAEMFLPLLVGGTAILVNEETAKDPFLLSRIISESQPHIIQATPATWLSLLDAGWSGSNGATLISTGEALPRNVASRLFPLCKRLWDFYGPTETTIWSTIRQVTPACLSGCIGRPIANTTVYILDQNGQPLPVGLPGELCIGGAGLARGYLNRPQLTAEKFVPDPFSADASARLYRTGDLCRWRDDGTLELLGRIDHQVKLRGFRVELGEIESVLNSHPMVAQCVVILREDRPEEKRLVAYCLPTTTGILNITELLQHLRRQLPDYMIPAAFVTLDAFPLTPSGKIDRLTLPPPDDSRLLPALPYTAPRSPMEEQVSSIWNEVLNIHRVGIHEDFFDLGGHSLLVGQLVARLRRTLQVELPVSQIFRTSTVADLAEWIGAARQAPEGLMPPPRLQPAVRGQRLPLSFAQQRLWFLEQLGVDTAYTMTLPLRYTGHLQPDILRRVLAAVAQRHETLRTIFPVTAGQPYQQILPDWEVPLTFVDNSHLSPPDAVSEAARLAQAHLAIPFDLAAGPLIRCLHIRMADDDLLVIASHHSICDGWSLDLLQKEIAEHYRAFSAGRELRLPLLSIQYADYAIWQRQWLDEERLGHQLAYWRAQLGDSLSVLAVPTDRPRPAVQTFRGASCPLQIPASLYESLRQFNRTNNVTMATTLLAGFKLLLARYTEQEDIVVGSPIAGRTQADIEELIGFFVNSLVLRTDLSGDPTFETLLKRVHTMALNAYDHQDVPFERLVDELAPKRDLTQNPLFQVVFAMQYGQAESDGPDAVNATPTFHRFPLDVTVTRMDMELHLFEQGGQISGQWVYNIDLFDALTIQRMVQHYLRLLENAVSSPFIPVSRLPMLGDDEWQQSVIDWNRTEAWFPNDRCIHELFEERVQERPDASALVFEDRPLSYGQLNAAANRVAHTLREMGVGPDTLVGLCVERSPDMIVGLLGILKAGGAYLPLDPVYPAQRLAFMLDDSQVPLLMTQTHLLGLFPAYTGQHLCLDNEWLLPGPTSAENPKISTTPHNLAYAIYTSGSTGEPKAALLDHRGLVNLAQAQQRAFGLTPDSRVLQFSSLSFDASTFEIVMALSTGATLYLGSREDLFPGPPLLDFLRRHRITIATLPPTALAVLPVDPLPALQTIAVAGESCPPELVSRWSAGRRFLNLYGPTESTIWATMTELQTDLESDGRPVPIGRPIANTQAYILDQHLQPVPVGVAGELHIGGVGLARGYHRRPGLTAERFIDNPFRRGERLYKSGDRTRFLADGTIEFLGRLDHQVKLRGFRIELGEVEKVLEQHPAVGRAAVVLDEDPMGTQDTRRLVGYIVGREEGEGAVQEQRQGERDELVSQWHSLYEDMYQHVSGQQDDAYRGWNSSYTNVPLPAHEMAQWVDGAVERIIATNPKRVLEIGCGTGLLLLRIAPHCQCYVGTDFSTAALDFVASQIERWVDTGPLADIRLVQCPASEVAGVTGAEEFDTILLNSVVQYFPAADYLVQVLKAAVEQIGESGHIFVGDVRSLPLLRAFHTSVQMEHAVDDSTPTQLWQRVNQAINHDRELVVDPAFFFVFAKANLRVQRVEVLPKRGDYDNELSRFRYDVILHIGAESPSVVPDRKDEWVDWQQASLTLPELRGILRDRSPSRLFLTGVPNARTQEYALTAEALNQPQLPASMQLLRAEVQMRLEESPPIALDTLWEIEKEMGYRVVVSWAAARSDGSFDVALYSPGEPTLLDFPRPFPVPTNYAGLTNDPLHSQRMGHLLSALRAHTQKLLPDYMIPSAFVLLDRLPLLPNGKLDRRALPAPDGLRPALNTSLTPPRSDAELKLSQVWQDVLGLTQVGIHDNFFELGGDSIQSVQVVAAARAAGLHITTRDLFQQQTVAGLAALAKPTTATGVAAESESIVGPVLLSAIQHWFFEQNQPEVHRFNQSILWDMAHSIDATALQALLVALVNHHDALRLRFQPSAGRWRQFVTESVAVVDVEQFDLTSIPAPERPAYIETIANQIQAKLDITRGPIMRAVLFTADDEAGSRLLWVIHHLAVDGVSWRILRDDLAQGWQQLQAGKPVCLPPRTHSIKASIDQLNEYAQTTALAGDVTYWLKQPWHLAQPLPLDMPLGKEPHRVSDSGSIAVALSSEQTRRLIHEVPSAYGTRINDALLTALLRSMAQWTKHPWLHFDLEGHGRTTIFANLDLSRTVGWFTTLYPLLLHWADAAQPNWQPGMALKSIKEQLRAVPQDGIGYGLARYLRQDDQIGQELRSQPQAQLSFNYLGQFDNAGDTEKNVRLSTLSAGQSISPLNLRQHLIEVNGAIIGGELQFTWAYSQQSHRPETVHALVQRFVEALLQLIEHCTAVESRGYTPSDFTALDVSQDELDAILAELSD